MQKQKDFIQGLIFFGAFFIAPVLSEIIVEFIF